MTPLDLVASCVGLMSMPRKPAINLSAATQSPDSMMFFMSRSDWLTNFRKESAGAERPTASENSPQFLLRSFSDLVRPVFIRSLVPPMRFCRMSRMTPCASISRPCSMKVLMFSFWVKVSLPIWRSSAPTPSSGDCSALPMVWAASWISVPVKEA